MKKIEDYPKECEGLVIDNEYYDDITHYAESMGEDFINSLPDGTVAIAHVCETRLLQVFTPEWITERIDDDRFSENNMEQEYEKVCEALRQSVDWDKLHSLMPEINYETKEKYSISKSDLLAAL